MLITLMPTTPKGPNDKETLDLGGVSNEKEAVINAVAARITPIVRMTLEVNVILGDLEECRIAHFACHSMSHPTDPSSSGLVL